MLARLDRERVSTAAKLGRLENEMAALAEQQADLGLKKSSISESDKVDLARRLTDPKVNRRKLGDS